MLEAGRVSEAAPVADTGGRPTEARVSVLLVRYAAVAVRFASVLNWTSTDCALVFRLFTTSVQLPPCEVARICTPEGAPVTLYRTEPGRTYLLYWPSA